MHIFHPFKRADVICQFEHVVLCLRDISAFGQPVIDHHLRRCRSGEEARRDVVEAEHRNGKDANGRAYCEGFLADKCADHALEALHQTACFLITRFDRPALGALVFDRLEQHRAKKRRNRNREDPAVEQRNQDHAEQVACELGRIARGKADRSESEDTHQGSTKQWPDRLFDHIAGYLDDLASALASAEHSVCHHDGVIHQHAERDNQSAQRNAVHRNVGEIHRTERRRDGEQKADADHKA